MSPSRGRSKTCAPRFSQYGSRGLGSHAPAEPIARFEHEHVAVAQTPRGREPGDAAAHHDDLMDAAVTAHAYHARDDRG